MARRDVPILFKETPESMARNSFTQRFRITRQGKVRRRAMALGHSRANKSGRQLLRKKKARGLSDSSAFVKHHLAIA
ncbi:MAG: hypothetical protein V1696_00045 [Candidatus Jorgensenbacteria bacterium]